MEHWRQRWDVRPGPAFECSECGAVVSGSTALAQTLRHDCGTRDGSSDDTVIEEEE